jgi:DNA polymerase-3 subunit epsilon
MASILKIRHSLPLSPEVWAEIMDYLKDCPVLVAHNAVFDIGCIRHSLELYDLPTPDIAYYCSLRAARHIYDFGCNQLDYLCDQFEIPYGTHHRAGDDAEMCARLFLREIKDAGWGWVEQWRIWITAMDIIEFPKK